MDSFNSDTDMDNDRHSSENDGNGVGGGVVAPVRPVTDPVGEVMREVVLVGFGDIAAKYGIGDYTLKIGSDIEENSASFRAHINKLVDSFRPITLEMGTTDERNARLAVCTVMNRWLVRVVNGGNGSVVAMRQVDTSMITEKKYCWVTWEESRFKAALSNLEITFTKNVVMQSKVAGGGTAPKNVPRKVNEKVYDIWTKESHANRSEVDAIAFFPGKANFGTTTLNMWQGFHYPYEKVKTFTNYKLIAPLLNHIKYAWCDSDDAYYQMCLRLASPLVRPWLKTEVAVCLGGPQGTGKTMVFDFYGRIVGNAHYIKIINSRDLTGEFTANLDYKTVCVVDDVNFDQSMETKNLLKNFISSTVLRKRTMRKDPGTVASHVNVFAVSNYIDKLVPADEDARRFECSYVDHVPLLDHPDMACFARDSNTYFGAITNLMTTKDEEGIKTFANFLYHFAPYLADWKHNQAKESVLLSMNKLRSLDKVVKWWAQKLAHPDSIYNNMVVSEEYASFCSVYQLEKRGEVSMDEFMNSLCSLIPKSTVEVSTANGKAVYTILLPMAHREGEESQYYDRMKPDIKLMKNHLTAKYPSSALITKQFNYDWAAVKKARLAKVTRTELLRDFIPKEVRDPQVPTTMLYATVEMPDPQRGTDTSSLKSTDALKAFYAAQEEMVEVVARADIEEVQSAVVCRCGILFKSACPDCERRDSDAYHSLDRCVACSVCGGNNPAIDVQGQMFPEEICDCSRELRTPFCLLCRQPKKYVAHGTRTHVGCDWCWSCHKKLPDVIIGRRLVLATTAIETHLASTCSNCQHAEPAVTCADCGAARLCRECDAQIHGQRVTSHHIRVSAGKEEAVEDIPAKTQPPSKKQKH
jgi:hypothetical protein